MDLFVGQEVKSEVFGIFKRFKAVVGKQSGKQLKALRSDGGGEYIGHEFRDLYEQEGIEHEVITPYTPEHNGAAEMRN